MSLLKIPRLVLTSALLSLGGCAVGPDFQAPQAQLPTQWRDAGAGGPASAPVAQPVNDAWWDSFGDPELSALVAEASAANPDILIAYERLRQSRAALRVSEADGLPAGRERLLPARPEQRGRAVRSVRTRRQVLVQPVANRRRCQLGTGPVGPRAARGRTGRRAVAGRAGSAARRHAVGARGNRQPLHPAARRPEPAGGAAPDAGQRQSQSCAHAATATRRRGDRAGCVPGGCPGRRHRGGRAAAGAARGPADERPGVVAGPAAARAARAAGNAGAHPGRSGAGAGGLAQRAGRAASRHPPGAGAPACRGGRDRRGRGRFLSAHHPVGQHRAAGAATGQPGHRPRRHLRRGPGAADPSLRGRQAARRLAARGAGPGGSAGIPENRARRLARCRQCHDGLS